MKSRNSSSLSLHLLFIALWLMLPAGLFAQTASAKVAPASKPLVIAHVTVIDVAAGTTRADQTVIIIRDRIFAVEAASKIKLPKGVQVIEAKGKFLIPGLWDMHVHLGKSGEASSPLFIANGVTSIREMGSEWTLITTLRQQIAEGSLIGPRIKAAGPILESTRFVQMLEKVTGESQAKMRVGTARVDEVPQAIQSITKLGVDFLKIRTNASRETYLAIAAEAKKAGLMLVGHAPTGVTLIEASDAGQRSIEHGLVLLKDLSENEWNETAKHFVSNHTYLVPTLIAGRAYRQMPDAEAAALIEGTTTNADPRRQYVPPALIEFWKQQMSLKKYESPLNWKLINEQNRQAFQRLHRAGVRMMPGTDLAIPLVYPGFSLHDELELLVNEIGLTPLEALQSATRHPAEFFGMQNSLGAIIKGSLADLVLLDASPLDNIANTKKIHAVVANGRLFSQTELKAILKQSAAASAK